MEIDFKRLCSTTASDHPDNSDTCGTDARQDYLTDTLSKFCDAHDIDITHPDVQHLIDNIELVWHMTLSYAKMDAWTRGARRISDVALMTVDKFRMRHE